MFASGKWRGFWEQAQFGVQEMQAFELHHHAGKLSGHGIDIVGSFTFTGEFDSSSGIVTLVKQYHGKHQVHYQGQTDGEGSLGGRWTIDITYGTLHVTDSGTFRMMPVLSRPRGHEPITEIGPA